MPARKSGTTPGKRTSKGATKSTTRSTTGAATGKGGPRKTSRTAGTSEGRKSTPRKSATSGSVASRSSTGSGTKSGNARKKSATKTAAKSAAKSTSRGARKTAAPSPAAQLREYQRKRDFTRTAEPAGSRQNKGGRPASTRAVPRTGELRFVIQKHEASHLHYDLRLEVDGVMKSWAVPKGPSADPSVKRLAMQVEDHPVEYNTFEGTIPAGEYGGGTVMLWDTGTYSVEGAADRAQNAAAHDQYERGEMKVEFHGKRMHGSYALVRTKGGMRGNTNPAKPSWLLIKHRDDAARPEQDFDLTREHVTSAVSGRSMDEIRERGRSL